MFRTATTNEYQLAWRLMIASWFPFLLRPSSSFWIEGRDPERYQSTGLQRQRTQRVGSCCSSIDVTPPKVPIDRMVRFHVQEMVQVLSWWSPPVESRCKSMFHCRLTRSHQVSRSGRPSCGVLLESFRCCFEDLTVFSWCLWQMIFNDI